MSSKPEFATKKKPCILDEDPPEVTDIVVVGDPPSSGDEDRPQAPEGMPFQSRIIVKIADGSIIMDHPDRVCVLVTKLMTSEGKNCHVPQHYYCTYNGQPAKNGAYKYVGPVYPCNYNVEEEEAFVCEYVPFYRTKADSKEAEGRNFGS